MPTNAYLNLPFPIAGWFASRYFFETAGGRFESLPSVALIANIAAVVAFALIYLWVSANGSLRKQDQAFWIIVPVLLWITGGVCFLLIR